MHWHDDALVIDLDEWAAPIPKRICGTIRLTPSSFPGRAFALDRLGRHVWQPIAPRARIEVSLDQPALGWSGTAYMDSNYGSEPLETGFRDWTWSRAHLEQDCVVMYDAHRRDDTETTLALRFDSLGRFQSFEPPPIVSLPSTFWRVKRETRATSAADVVIRNTLEDTPFYARTRFSSKLLGETAECFHESLSLDRFASPLVQAMLPFRMPRWTF